MKLEKLIKKIKGKIIKVHCDVMNYDDLKQKIEKIKIIDILDVKTAWIDLIQEIKTKIRF